MYIASHDLLAYSRAGISDRILKRTDCNTVIATAMANLDTAISKYRAVITHSNLLIVLADEVQMVQLLQNLLDNAIKYRSRKKSKIHISAEQ